MRLHQRVGRLNRYGQRHQVEVLNIRNPDTVESVIWEKLDGKIRRITRALASAMDEPEDLLELVLGMTDPNLFSSLFAEAQSIPKARLDEWVDEKTSQFGGEDVLTAVREIVGNAAHFDYGQVSDLIPKLDLPDLAPFFKLMLGLNHRQIRDEGGALTFNTPKPWLEEFGVLPVYRDLVFDRDLPQEDSGRLLGVGHRLMEMALRQARALPGLSATAPGLEEPLLIFQIADSLTGTDQATPTTLVGVSLGAIPKVRLDWEILQWTNTLPRSTLLRDDGGGEMDVALPVEVARGTKFLEKVLPQLYLGYTLPRIDHLAAFLPATETPGTEKHVRRQTTDVKSGGTVA